MMARTFGVEVSCQRSTHGPVLMGADDARSVVASWPDGSVAVAEVGDYPLQRVERGPGRDRPGRRAPIGAGGTTRRRSADGGVSRDGRQVHLTNSLAGGSTLATSTAHTAHRSWVTRRSGSTPASSRYRSSPAANPGPDLGADLLTAQPGDQRRGQLIGGSGRWSPGRAESRRWRRRWSVPGRVPAARLGWWRCRPRVGW